MNKHRIDDVEILRIEFELEQWRLGKLGLKLTWFILEKSTGFTRQALHNQPRIRAAYIAAKKALRTKEINPYTESESVVKGLEDRIQTLEAAIALYVNKEKQWQARWQRIAFHLRGKGLNVSEIDREPEKNSRLPSMKQTENILSFYDKSLDPSGRK